MNRAGGLTQHPAADLLVGLGVSTAVLVVLQGTRLLWSGSEYFEWGFLLSLGISWVAVATGFVAGWGIVVLLSVLLQRLGVTTHPRIKLLAVLIVLFMYAAIEVPVTSKLRAEVLTPLEGLLVSVVAASVATILLGRPKREHQIAGVAPPKL